MLRLAWLLLLLALPAMAQPVPLSLTAPRGELLLAWSDGRVMRGAELLGGALTIAGQRVTLAAAQPDPEDRQHEIWLYRLRLADGGEFCEPDPKGERWALTLPDAAAPGGFRLTCSGGANGKCLRFGYPPWREVPGVGSLAPWYAACTNLVRAAYGGPERGWTRNGMPIDIYDRIGIQAPAHDPGQRFEAGWTPDGAVCVAHVRVPENGGLDAVRAAAPRLAGRLGPRACTEARAAGWGALLFNRSPVRR